MADTVTTTLGLTKPEVGASEDSWGEKINTNFDLVDDALDGTTAVSLDINGGTIDGAVIGGATPAAITGTAITGTSFATSGDFTFGDNDKAIFGAGSDLQIYHDGSDSYIDDNGTGDLFIRGGDDVVIGSMSGEEYIRMNQDSSVELKFNNATKLYTQNTGATVNGDLTVTGNAVFGDNDKAIFGAGSDLQIYHDGSDSIINDSGTGNLFIRGTSTIILGGVTSNNVLINDGADVKLRYNSADKLATTSTGIDVTGTVTADGLSVSGSTTTTFNSGAENVVATFTSTDTEAQIALVDTTGTSTIRARNDFRFHVNNAATPALKIDSNNDISFYEDTGTTPKFFWDASAESLGIGTSSPTYASGAGVSIYNAGAARLKLGDSTSGIGQFDGLELIYDDAAYLYNREATPLIFGTNDTERMRIDSSGNVGIGTSSPSSLLEVSDVSGNPAISITADALGVSDLNLGDENDLDVGRIRYAHAINSMIFNTNGSEAMRIDASGNLLVGTTDISPATNNVDGAAIRSEGHINVSRSGGVVGYFNRRTSDGTILDLRKNGAPVGSIGVRNGTNLNVSGSSSHAGLEFSSSAYVPFKNGTTVNGQINLGSSFNAYKDLYLSGGVYLGGTGAANKLDDYETGTWTPTVKGETTAGTATYLGRWGNYTKIGNLVTVRFYLNVSSFNGTGVMRISGLPFTSGVDSGIAAGGINPVRVNGTINLTTDGVISLAIVEGSTEAIFFSTRVTSSATSSTIDCDSAWAGQFEGSYFV